MVEIQGPINFILRNDYWKIRIQRNIYGCFQTFATGILHCTGRPHDGQKSWTRFPEASFNAEREKTGLASYQG